MGNQWTTYGSISLGLAAILMIGLITKPSSSQVPSSSTSAEPTSSVPSEPLIDSKVSGNAPKLKDAVDVLVRKVKTMGGSVGVAIIDVETGELLAAHQEHKAYNPASNAKILTAAAALWYLKPSHRYQTALYGHIHGSSISTLVLRGSGDPSLTTKDLYSLAASLKHSGVKKVDDILVDQRFFDDKFTPPAFEQQPNEWARFRAPVSAVAVNENCITMTVRPSVKGAPALVSFEPPGFVDVEGSIKTADKGNAQNILLALQPAGTKLGAKISGTIPEHNKPLNFTRRVENPNLLAGYVLKSTLTQLGISVNGDIKQGGEHRQGAPLAMHSSRPLSTLLYELGKESDNFYAEMIFKSLALETKGKPAAATNAAEVVTKYLQDIGALEDGVIVKNGSGLFDANRITAASLVKLLRVAFRDSRYSSEFVAHLAIGAADGTLRSRFRHTKGKHIVRAKTGTLEAAATLSGYVLAPPGKSPIAFSILINEIPGKVGSARTVIDKCVDAMIRHLWSNSKSHEKEKSEDDDKQEE